MAISSILVKYDLDLTGMNPNNLVRNEPHVVPREKNRGFAVNYGAFFTNPTTLHVVHHDTGYELKPGIDFIALHLYELAAKRAGQEVCAAIMIVNDDLDGQFDVTYQVVGGEFSANTSIIQQLIDALDLDERPVYWGEILGLPSDFPPSDHLHDIDDLYGFEYVVAQLARITAAIKLGDYHDHEEIRQRIRSLRQYVDSQDQAIVDIIQAHLDDENNPHNTTKTQVGLGNVDNFKTATKLEAEAGTANNVFMTALRVAEAIAKQVGIPLQNHIDDNGNPHGVTKTQVGLGNVQNFPVATDTELDAGTANNRYVVVSGAFRMIKKFAIDPLTAHLEDKQNPHDVTKTQVGLGNVDNFKTATQLEAQAGTSNTVFLTALRGAELVKALVGDAFTSHVGDKNNPHATTKTQVGLGSVDNFATATVTQASAGTATNLFVTPAGLLRFWNDRIGNYVPWSSVASGGGAWAAIVSRIPFIQSNGLMEIGKYLDWHDTNSSADYNIREVCQPASVGGWNGYEIYNTGYYNCIDAFFRSDIRDKTGIEIITPEDANKALLEIENGISYQMKGEQTRTVGLSAQAVQKAAPLAVVKTQTESGQERLSLRSGGLNGYFVSGYNYQAKKIAGLEAENAKLKQALLLLAEGRPDIAALFAKEESKES